MTMMPAAVRDAYAMHTDTYVSGPPWAEFAKAMGIDEAAQDQRFGVPGLYLSVRGWPS